METKTLRTVAVLCVNPRSAYKNMPGVECFDKNRDARTFLGDMPAVGHPPCRHWSIFCRHQADQLEKEQEMNLGIWVADRVRECGGVLEHPAFSGLWRAAGLPIPGKGDQKNWSIEVWQSWWGFPQIKRTWLYFSGLTRRDVEFPFTLHGEGRDKRQWQIFSKAQRNATYPAFAQWLVDTARKSHV